MRLLLLMIAAALIVPAVSFAQQIPSNAVQIHESAEGGYRWGALLDLLDVRKAMPSYDDVNRALLSKFDRRDEWSRPSTGNEGSNKGVECHSVKSHCREGVVIRYDGRTHVFDGDKPTFNELVMIWQPSPTLCLPADASLTLLRDHAWRVQDLRQHYRQGVPPTFDESIPNTEIFRSDSNHAVLSVSWVSKENPAQLKGIDPSQGCLQYVQISDH